MSTKLLLDCKMVKCWPLSHTAVNEVVISGPDEGLLDSLEILLAKVANVRLGKNVVYELVAKNGSSLYTAYDGLNVSVGLDVEEHSC